MNDNETTFNTIFEDLKTSLRLAKNNLLSYLLANLGMALLLGVIFAVVSIPIISIVLLTGPHDWAVIGQIMTEWAQNNPWAIGGVGLLFLIPIASLFLIVVGSIFGMSKEVVETGETKAESAFSWFRHNFLTFAGTGVILTLIIIIPQVVVGGAISLAMNYQVPLLVSQILSVASFVYTFITVGLFAMVFPAVVNGKGVQEAFKESFSLATNRFDRVFGLITAIFVFFVLLFSPAIVWGLLVGSNPAMALNPASIAVGIYSAIAGILTLLLFLPMMIISFVKVYHELTGGEVFEGAKPDIPMV
ncbi:MAG: hypothetical protein GF309_16195 [Candidatus Lokiarchaeota archaeon]|nr:hypothetical protein [Candidatus Lokiarchaeota archaeon]